MSASAIRSDLCASSNISSQPANPTFYTIEKQGIKKLIYHTPWRKNGQIMGVVEFSMENPLEMPPLCEGMNIH